MPSITMLPARCRTYFTPHTGRQRLQGFQALGEKHDEPRPVPQHELLRREEEVQGRRAAEAALDHRQRPHAKRGDLSRKNLEIEGSSPSHSNVLLPRVFEVFGVAVTASVVRAAIVKQGKKQMKR